MSRATKLSGSLGTPDLPAVNLEALLECRKVKAAPTVDTAAKAVRKSYSRKVRGGFMHVCARVGIACNCGSQSATVYLCHGVLSIVSLCVFVCCVDADAQVPTAEED